MKDIYLPAYKQKVDFSTYKTAMAHHNLFVTSFGKKQLKAITPQECELFRIRLINDYSKNYAKNLWSRFKACLDYAERLGYISKHPCLGLDNPKGKHPVTEFWTFEEFKKVMRTFDCSEYEDRHRYTTIWLYYMTGVRVSEGLALKWKDIDFDKKLLNVHATLEKDENGNWYAKQQTKTVAGLRKIDLDDVTLEVLTNWREVQVQNGEDDYVLSRFGNPLCKSTICRIIKRQAEIVDVPKITGKGLRHSHASYLLNVLKMDPLYVSHRLGHADKSTTLNVYSHWYHNDVIGISDKITQNILQSKIF